MSDRLPAPGLPDWMASQVPFDRYLVKVGDGLHIHVMESGEGRPVLLFHGNPTWGFLYNKVVRQLRGEPFRLIMPDLMGLGFSARVSPDRHTLANHASWMGELVGSLGLSDAMVAVHDWGGPIGLHAMSRHPGLMSGLVVMNTSLGPPRPGFTPTPFHRVFSSKLGGGIAQRLGVVERAMGRAYLHPLQKLGNEGVVALVRMVPDDLQHPSVQQLTEVAAFVENYDGPAAIVWGDRDRVLGRLKNRGSRSLPQASVTSTEAGHFVPRDVPIEVADAIRQIAGAPLL